MLSNKFFILGIVCVSAFILFSILYVVAIGVFLHAALGPIKSLAQEDNTAKIQTFDQAMCKTINQKLAPEESFSQEAKIVIDKNNMSGIMQQVSAVTMGGNLKFKENESLLVTVTVCGKKASTTIPCNVELENKLLDHIKNRKSAFPFNSALLVGDSRTGKTYTADIIASFNPGKTVVLTVSASSLFNERGVLSPEKKSVILQILNSIISKYGCNIVFLIDELDKVIGKLPNHDNEAVLGFFDEINKNEKICLIVTANSGRKINRKIKDATQEDPGDDVVALLLKRILSGGSELHFKALNASEAREVAKHFIQKITQFENLPKDHQARITSRIDNYFTNIHKTSFNIEEISTITKKFMDDFQKRQECISYINKKQKEFDDLSNNITSRYPFFNEGNTDDFALSEEKQKELQKIISEKLESNAANMMQDTIDYDKNHEEVSAEAIQRKNNIGDVLTTISSIEDVIKELEDSLSQNSLITIANSRLKPGSNSEKLNDIETSKVLLQVTLEQLQKLCTESETVQEMGDKLEELVTSSYDSFIILLNKDESSRNIARAIVHISKEYEDCFKEIKTAIDEIKKDYDQHKSLLNSTTRDIYIKRLAFSHCQEIFEKIYNDVLEARYNNINELHVIHTDNEEREQKGRTIQAFKADNYMTVKMDPNNLYMQNISETIDEMICQFDKFIVKGIVEKNKDLNQPAKDNTINIVYTAIDGCHKDFQILGETKKKNTLTKADKDKNSTAKGGVLTAEYLVKILSKSIQENKSTINTGITGVIKPAAGLRISAL